MRLDFTYSTDDTTVCLNSRMTSYSKSSNPRWNPGAMVSEVRHDTMWGSAVVMVTIINMWFRLGNGCGRANKNDRKSNR